MSSNNVIFGINGPVVTVKDAREFSMQEMVFVGDSRLVGEVITHYRQVHDHPGLRKHHRPAPGRARVYDGAPDVRHARPRRHLQHLRRHRASTQAHRREVSGAFIERGVDVSPLDEEKLWDVTVTAKPGRRLSAAGADLRHLPGNVADTPYTAAWCPRACPAPWSSRPRTRRQIQESTTPSSRIEDDKGRGARADALPGVADQSSRAPSTKAHTR
jgi:hypothetical protein